jgi:hypothetical protein
MIDEWSVARKIAKASGVFGDYEIHGEKLENEGGARFWRIQAWKSGENPPRYYYVFDNELFSAVLEYFDDDEYPMRIQMNGLATDIMPEKRKSILDTIAQWESNKN